jgi:hypothetical protein
VQRKTREGLLPHVRLGHRTLRYDLDAVLAALGSASGRKTPPARTARRPAPPPAAVRDLPAYDWSSSPPADATLPPADRRG